jgi:hypothetical protein
MSNAGNRVCKAPLPYQKQRLKLHIRDANAECMINPLAGGFTIFFTFFTIIMFGNIP